jgi:hypothetical protein
MKWLSAVVTEVWNSYDDLPVDEITVDATVVDGTIVII